MSNTKKSATLGMPHGTATNRLRKMILFNVLKRHNENICVRCNLLIELADDLSIEHLKAWEGVSADLFWDLDNVAFSHLRCNVPHSRPGPKIKVPDGTAWCSRHRAALPISEFHKSSGSDDGVKGYCKSCIAAIDTRQNHAKKV